MKNYLLLLLIPFLSFSQSNYLALKLNGSDDHGNIININNDVEENSYQFFDNGAPPTDRLVEINGFLYGLTDHFGDENGGTLYRYDYTNETFEVLLHFDDMYSHSKLVAGNNKLYLIETGFFSSGYIIEIDPVSLDKTYVVGLGNNGIDTNKYIDFIYTAGNKLFGISESGGTNNNGILFSYDLTSGNYTIKHEFDAASLVRPKHIMYHSNGKIYGVTSGGGANGYGMIFEFDPSNDTFTKLYDLTATNEAYTLVEGDTNKLYGFTNPQSGGGGRIYQFDIATHSFNNIHYFSTGLDGSFSYYPLVYKNHRLYGTNKSNTSQEGMLFTYDLNNNSFNSYAYHIVSYQTAPLVKTHDDRIFFTTKENFIDSFGAIFEFDTATNHFIKANNVDFGTNGVDPLKMIVSSNTGMVYGITDTGPGPMTPNYGTRLFSYNFETKEYKELINFSFENYGGGVNNIIESSNGLIYVTTGYTSGFSGEGYIIEYNPNNNTHSIVHSFSSESYGHSYLNDPVALYEKDNIIYGYKKQGGGSTLHNGTIFSFNTLTHTYNILYESAELENVDVNSLISILPENKIYGATTTGGTHDKGYIFSFDVPTNTFNVIENIQQSGITDLTRTESGDIYGVFEHSHGPDGCIFKIDSNDNFSVYYQFDNPNIPSTGFSPHYIKSVGNNLYVITFADDFGSSEGTGDKDLLIEINTLTNSFNTITYIVGNPGATKIYPVLYKMDDNRLIGNSIYGLYSYTQGDNDVVPLGLSENIFNIIDISNVTVSISDQENTFKKNLSVYPNPVSKYINIKTDKPSSISDVTILNSIGKQILKKSNTNKIDVSSLKNGLYFIKIIDNEGNIKVSKIIKKSR